MQKLPAYLYLLGLGLAIIAAVLGIASIDAKATARHAESAIALAVVAYVFIPASEQLPK